MKILFIGDTFGKDGRRALIDNVPKIIKERQIDFTIVNGENVSHGKSLTFAHYKELKEIGVDVFTMGNHSFWGNKLDSYAKKTGDVIVPENYNPYNDFKGTGVYKCKGKTIRVTNVLGQTFMYPIPENPFFALEKIINEDESDIHIVDIHAEATSEKIALATYFDGKISAGLGTHTHVQTADERILPKGTAFITDAGMTGPRFSIIGIQSEPVIKKLKTGITTRFEPASSRYQLMGVVITFDDKTNRATKIARINLVEK